MHKKGHFLNYVPSVCVCVCVCVCVNIVYHFLPIVSCDCTSSCCSIVILMNMIFASIILMYFQMRCSVTANSQANNTTELLQYSWKIRDAKQDKTSLYHAYITCVF